MTRSLAHKPVDSLDPMDGVSSQRRDRATPGSDIGMEAAQVMRLAKITLVGFKSFADRTEFTFDDPITAIVGPNGCGKSNIVDAIKWVLGERSAKSLRSKEMQDVIFAGSAGRAPAGMASVTLSFMNPLQEPSESNQQDPSTPALDAADESSPDSLINRQGVNRTLPIDSEVVDVQRRLYRDGGSQYLINGKRARLRDIRDLFLDTGVGADAYSIIEQGKVDAMLLSSPVDRRSIFEEAAGVAKFRVRRIESQRKLDRTEVNLIRAREQLESTERRLRAVHNQAARARRFKELDSRYRGLRIALMLHQNLELNDRLNGLTSRLIGLQKEQDDAVQTLESLEEHKQNHELARHDLLSQRQAVESDLTAAEHEGQHAAQREALAERSLEETESLKQHEDERAEELRRGASQVAQAEQALADSIIQLEAALLEVERECEEESDRRTALQQSQVDRREQLGNKQAACEEINRERTALVVRIEAETNRAQMLRQEQEKREQAAHALVEEETTLQADQQQASAAVASTKERIGATQLEVDGLEQDLSTLSNDQQRLGGRLSSLEQRRISLDSRRQTLQEMVDAHAGLDDAPRAVLNRKNTDSGDGPFSCVLAPLADLIETDAPHAQAVEAALGSNLQALVVRSMTELIDSGALRELSGRVVFLAADSTQDTPDCVSPENIPSGVTPVRQLVH